MGALPVDPEAQPLRILICGAKGQLALELMSASASSSILDCAAVGRPELDICDAASVERTIVSTRPAIVINAAAYTAVDRAETEKDQAFAVNRDGAQIVAEITARHAIPLIHISTDYVFDGAKPSPYTETDATNPRSVYGKSKRDGEMAVAQANPRHLILRTAWVYSAFGQNFLKTMLRLAAERPDLRVVADQHGNPTDAGDLARAIFSITGRIADAGVQDERWGTYHLVGEGNTTWHGFASHIVMAAARHGRAAIPVHPISTAEYPTPAARPSNSRLDCRKFADTFGISLPPWTESVNRCVAQLCGDPQR